MTTITMTNNYKYIIVNEQDFVGGDDNKVFDTFTEASFHLKHFYNESEDNDDGSVFTLLRADDEDSEFNYCLEDNQWVKYA